MKGSEELYGVIGEVFKLDSDRLSDETRLQDLEEWDSMSHMIFVTQLEKTYVIELTGEEIAAMRCVGDIKRILETRSKAQP